MTRQEALDLLLEFNKDEFHIRHALTVEGVMRILAAESGHADEAELWALTGLLHDLDFEMYPDEHCVKEEQIMRERGVDPVITRACVSHGWGINVDVEPVSDMEKTLFAVDELTGLIGAVAIVHPSKSVAGLEVKSVKKKFKDKKFAAGCSRDVIQRGAELLGKELGELIDMTLRAQGADEQRVGAELERLKEEGT